MRFKLRCRAVKAKGGFSYIEVTVSFAIFLVLVAASLPLINSAARNLAFARNGYYAHLAAGRLMQSVRLSLTAGNDIKASVASVSPDVYAYSIWVGDQDNHTTVRSENAPDADISFAGDLCIGAMDGLHIIIVVIWGDCGGVLGRTVGAVYL